MSPWLSVETQVGRALRSNGREIRPVAWSLQLKLQNSALPFGLYFRWVRPLAVEVRSPEGTTRIPIPDFGLYVAWGAALLVVTSLVVAAGRGAGASGRRR